MEERRKANDRDWDSIRNFIIESREYRIKDEVTQKFQIENIEALKNQVKIQNGRVGTLEKWQESIQTRIKEKIDRKSSMQAVITVVATVIMAISAIVMIFIKK